ncbi:type VII secretion protein EccCa [Corynebacterium uropygiale]|uniref:Type VII secretion protein EccCa n=1 Tax=Corynebacterium uropygiale TaxID=1775911 RepID=A0A9X1QQG1_9CORY|nr:type VII secretion protein EccCa [Corynebacterium uropygiale]MCF4005948.1 type VII secretion protein EccCa [Corynebacterium uropygiale]
MSTIVPAMTMADREAVPPVPHGTIDVEAVPGAKKGQKIPLMRIIVPVIMVAAMVGMVLMLFLGQGTVHPMMLLFPIMMVASLFMSMSSGSGTDIDETRRTYLRHLGSLRERALSNAREQRRNSTHRHPHPADLRGMVGSRRMWERAPGDPDVLELRLGVGTMELCTPIEVKDPGAAEDLDPVCAVSLRHTLNAVGMVGDMPIALQLQAFGYVGLCGPCADDVARSLIAQILFHHGPECVGIHVVGTGWEWLKWVPHRRDEQRAQHRILLVDRVDLSETDDVLAENSWDCVISIGCRPGTYLRSCCEDEGLLLLCGETLAVLTEDGQEDIGRPDRLDRRAAVDLARRMSPYERPSARSRESAPGDAHTGLLGLLGIADLAKVDMDTLWEPRGQANLAIPFGIDDGGAPVILDIKESAKGGMGPHGLCIGATGSGKSETLRTLVVSLVATHSPREVNLVLVDFKGGATFLGLERLPHTSAVITNLEEESILVERMHDAISGELHRRQEVLRRAGNFANVSEYNAACSEREDLEPMPALFIVVDEFSELLGQHPDFADLFVAVGRVGRSLHVHLLLASQRLEEGKLRGLDSHLSYRLGLKTFSAAESRQVLGVPDAHQLPASPGAGFLRSDADQLTRFQASYVSGPVPRRVYRRSEGTAMVRPFRSWEDIRLAQGEISEAEEIILDESTTVLDAVVDKAVEAAARRGERAHQMWLPPLPARMDLASIAGATGDYAGWAAPLGIIDRPYQQRQDVFLLSLDEAGGHCALCGGPRSGKSTALASMAVSFAVHHGPDELAIYVLDCGGALGFLSHLPQVAGIAGRDEEERLRRIIDELMNRVDGAEDIQPGRTILLLIDGWHTIHEEYEDLVEPITRLAADGPAAGIHLCISTPRWGLLRPAIRDLLHHRIELRMSDPLDSIIDRQAQARVPLQPGRGITPDAEQLLIAACAAQDAAHVANVWEKAGQSRVPALAMLPDVLHRSALPAASPEGLPLGIGGPRLDVLQWNPQRDPHLLCVGSQGSGKSTVLRSIAEGFAELGRERVRLVLIDHRRSHLGALPEEMLAAYSASSATTAQVLRDVVTTVTSRLPGPEVTAEQLKARDWWEGPEIVVIIDDADLVSDADLHPLIALLPHARDVGLHMVVARKSGGIGRALYAAFFAALKDQLPALVLLDADKEEGPILGVKPTRQPVGRAAWQCRTQMWPTCRMSTSTTGENDD